eukprot:scaffold1537_cov162-Ochromonas_danica.AAC.22
MMKKKIIKGVTYDSQTGEVITCLFCRIHQREEPGRIAFEDDDTVVFYTIDPASRCHLLVTPRQHVKNVTSLEGLEGISLVEKLVKTGKDTLEQLGEDVNNAKFCFHIPPFNSIDHLHLHAIGDVNHMTWTEDIIETLRKQGNVSSSSSSSKKKKNHRADRQTKGNE